MDDVKKAVRSDCSTPNGAREPGDSPVNQDITNTERKQGEIERILPHGEENAVKTKTLVLQTGAKNVRCLMKQIENERKAGAVILSTVRNGGGYFLPDTGEKGRIETQFFVKTMKARAVSIFRAVRAARQSLQQIDGQEDLKM